MKPAQLKRELRDALAALGLDDAQASTQATALAAQLIRAWLTHGGRGAPNTSAVSKELAQIAKLSRNLHHALNKHSIAAGDAMTRTVGGPTSFRGLRSDALRALEKLYTASNQSVSSRGRKTDRYADAVADACAAAFTEAMGRRPGRSVHPTSGRLGGPFYRLVNRVFVIARVKGKPSTQVNRIVGKRRTDR